jgi:phosphohistidine phosphatase
MDLILWRHAEARDALEGEDDLQRKLTGKGERQAERMAQWLNRRLAPSTRILVSPALRCRQTAAPLGRDVETVAALGPDTSVQAVLDAARWPSASEPVLIVGLQPTLGLVAAHLLAGVEQAWSMKKGAVWWLRAREAEGGVALLAVIGPEWV